MVRVKVAVLLAIGDLLMSTGWTNQQAQGVACYEGERNELHSVYVGLFKNWLQGLESRVHSEAASITQPSPALTGGPILEENTSDNELAETDSAAVRTSTDSSLSTVDESRAEDLLLLPKLLNRIETAASFEEWKAAWDEAWGTLKRLGFIEVYEASWEKISPLLAKAGHLEDDFSWSNYEDLTSKEGLAEQQLALWGVDPVGQLAPLDTLRLMFEFAAFLDRVCVGRAQ